MSAGWRAGGAHLPQPAQDGDERHVADGHLHTLALGEDGAPGVKVVDPPAEHRGEAHRGGSTATGDAAGGLVKGGEMGRHRSKWFHPTCKAQK